MSDIHDPRRIPVQSGPATNCANPTATATPRTDLRKLLRVLLNKAHTQGQDDYRQGASHSSVTRHGEEFNAAEDAMCRAIDTLERELSSAQAALTEAKAEVARLNGALHRCHIVNPATDKTPFEEIDQLRARVAELEQDKARLQEYAFGMETALRGARASGTASETALWAAECAELRLRNATLTAAIDAAKGRP